MQKLFGTTGDGLVGIYFFICMQNSMAWHGGRDSGNEFWMPKKALIE